MRWWELALINEQQKIQSANEYTQKISINTGV
jgi:hypothetical protein